MGRLISICSATLVAISLSSGALAGNAQEERVNKAIDVLQDFTAIPEQGVPPSLLANAYGVAVIPGVIKAGLMVGGRYGKGILIVRQPDGAWSNPAFISLGGASFGWQIGAQSTDLMLVFKDRRSIANIANGKVTLGGDASVAAGPVGRSASAATDGRLEAEIYSYARNRGLFAGVALDGAWLRMDKDSNDAFYGNGLSPMQLLDARNIPAPIAAQQFVKLMAATAPRINMDNAVQAATAVMPAAGTPGRATNSAKMDDLSDIPADGEVRTYAIDPIEGGGDETMF